MKFKDLQTGAILETENEFSIEQFKSATERYEKQGKASKDEQEEK